MASKITPRIFLAGKIGHNDWRHDLFPSLDRELRAGKEGPVHNEWAEYAGPFFVSLMKNPRASAPSAFPHFEYVPYRCFNWMDHSDIMYTWLECETAHATLIELGYAKAIGLPVFLAVSDSAISSEGHPLYEELWFARELAARSVDAPTPEDGFKALQEWLTDDFVIRTRELRGGTMRCPTPGTMTQQ